MPTTVNIHEAKTHLSPLLDRVRNGEAIVIAKAGEPIATLTPYVAPQVVLGDLTYLRWSISDEDWDDSDRAVAELFGALLAEPIEPDSC